MFKSVPKLSPGYIKIGNKISIIIPRKQMKIYSNVLILSYFWNITYLQGLNYLVSDTQVFYLIFVLIALIHVCFLKYFKGWV